MSSWIPYLAALMAAKVRAFPRRARCRSRLVSSVVSDKPFLRGRVSSLVTKTAGLSGEEGGADPGSLKSAPVTQSGGSTNLGSHHKVGRTTLVEEPEKLFQCS
jgi:hypothetical protein